VPSPRPSAASWRRALGISAIVWWELAKLVQLGRVDLDLGSPELIKALASVELIAATSVVHSVPLLTRDRRIRRSKMVPLAPSR
jgi:hypothetical protein